MEKYKKLKNIDTFWKRNKKLVQIIKVPRNVKQFPRYN